jgi:hypothetical protein
MTDHYNFRVCFESTGISLSTLPRPDFSENRARGIFLDGASEFVLLSRSISNLRQAYRSPIRRNVVSVEPEVTDRLSEYKSVAILKMDFSAVGIS